MLHFFIISLFMYYRYINITNTLIHFFISTFVYVFFVYVFSLYLFLCGYKLIWCWTQSEAQLQWCDLLQRRSCYCCVKEQKSWQKFKKIEFDNCFWRTWQSMTFRSDSVGGTVSAFSCCTPWVTALSIISAAAAAAGVFQLEIYSSLPSYWSGSGPHIFSFSNRTLLLIRNSNMLTKLR